MILEKENRFFIHDRPVLKNWKYAVKIGISHCLEIFYKISLTLSHVKIQPKKHYVSICAIFKNEASYLKEWIEYHRIIGVEHFYLYNNFSDDNYLEVLAPYVEQGIVDLYDWPKKAGQISAYEDCLNKNKDETNWICFIDLDEFICPFKHQNISEWLSYYEKYPSVVAYWKMFGSSGKLVREKSFVIEDFTISWNKLVDIGKPFLNTNFEIKKILFTHWIIAQFPFLFIKHSLPSINEFKKFIFFGINRVPIWQGENTIQINHYYSKTYEEYMNKKRVRGYAYDNTKVYEINDFLFQESMNANCDYKIFRYLVQLKMNMEINGKK